MPEILKTLESWRSPRDILEFMGDTYGVYKPDAWVAVYPAPFHRLKKKLYHQGFRGWRYFDLESYRGTMDAKIHV
jgi:hypothetical protein